MRSTSSQPRGFTIIELLVAIGIISVLAGILLPVVSRIRRAARDAVCASNLRQITTAFISFSKDNEGHLPGGPYGPNDGSYTQSDWLYGQGDFAATPIRGTIYGYVKNPKVYLCPSLDPLAVGGQLQSNGHFDYAAFSCFEGTNTSTIGLQSKLTQLDGKFQYVMTPIVCQEDPFQFNGPNIEGGHSNVDQMTHIHHGGSYYGAIDGSVQWVNEPDKVKTWSTGCWQWTSQTVNNHEVSLAVYGGWNWWAKQ